jgi:hypothetical protein
LRFSINPNPQIIEASQSDRFPEIISQNAQSVSETSGKSPKLYNWVPSSISKILKDILVALGETSPDITLILRDTPWLRR